MPILFQLLEWFATFIELMGCIILFSHILDSRYHRNRRTKSICISVICSTLVLIINNIRLFSFMNGILSIAIVIVVQYLIFDENIGLLSLLSVAYLLIVVVIDFVSIQIFSVAYNVKTNILLSNYSLKRTFCVLASKTTLLLVIYLIKKLIKNRRKFSIKYALIISVIAIILIFLNYYVIELSRYSNSTEFRLFSAIFFVSSLIIMVLILNFWITMTENHRQKSDIINLEVQNKVLLNAHKEKEELFALWRKSIHDYSNKIIILDNMLKNNQIDDVKQIISAENELMSKKLFTFKTGNEIIDIVLNTKNSLAENKNINMIVHAKICEEIQIERMDLASLLGNIIDNAIEACEKCDDSKQIELYIKRTKNTLIIREVNPYTGTIDKKFASSKKDSIYHGIGLKSINEIVTKYGGTMQIYTANNKFDLTIIIDVFDIN